VVQFRQAAGFDELGNVDESAVANPRTPDLESGPQGFDRHVDSGGTPAARRRDVDRTQINSSYSPGFSPVASSSFKSTHTPNAQLEATCSRTRND
jgi:hypothetical protein